MLNFNYAFERIGGWIRKNKAEAVVLILILLLGSILRLYRISEFMTFLGDEGRDAIIVRRLLVNFDPILIGPGSSIGNIYLGPLYYYLIAPALLLSYFNPVGPSIMIALFGVATIFLIWIFFKEWFNTKGVTLKGVNVGALIAAFFYAISPTVIIYSRSSWNPNIMPFFAILCVYSIWKIWHERNFKWFIVLAISYAFVLQSHYLGLILLPVFGLFIFITLLSISFSGLTYRNKKEKADYKEKRGMFYKNSIISSMIFLFLMSPLVIFDIRHGWNNFNAIKKFFLERQTTVSAKPWTGIPKIDEIFTAVNTSLLGGKNDTVGSLVTLTITLTALTLCIVAYKNKFKKKESWALILILTWLFFALIGLSVYKQHIYDHYFTFFFPAPFILLGLTLTLVRKNKILLGLFFLFLFYLTLINFQNTPIKNPPNNQMHRAEEVAKLIEEKSGGKKLNLAVIAERNYEDGYQYFLEKDRVPVSDINPLELSKTVADQLFVVCEVPKEKCDPTHSPKSEVANFGWSKIDGEWEVSGITVYKLVHSI